MREKSPTFAPKITHTMRYVSWTSGLALLWVITGCASGPSEAFKGKVAQELTDLKNATQKVTALKDEASKMQDPFASLKEELGKNWEKVEKDKDLSGKVGEITQAVQGLVGEVGKLEEQVNSALSKAQSFVDGLATQQKKDEELTGEWDGIKNEVNAAASQVDALNTKLTELKNSISSLSEEVKKKYGAKK
ncbi:MAG: hypothetical protein NZ580_02845 [Bacteroidia bacterium]|nr:hypothetical protein [Bacteroidia bacterium]